MPPRSLNPRYAPELYWIQQCMPSAWWNWRERWSFGWPCRWTLSCIADAKWTEQSVHIKFCWPQQLTWSGLTEDEVFSVSHRTGSTPAWLVDLHCNTSSKDEHPWCVCVCVYRATSCELLVALWVCSACNHIDSLC